MRERRSSQHAGRRLLARLGAVLAGLMWVAACSSAGDELVGAGDTVDGTDTTHHTVPSDTNVPSDANEPPESTGAGAQPQGFTTISGVITAADGEVCEVCLWLADSADERARGLMGVTDLGAADGMAFVFSEPTSGSFYMFQTPTPLSIAWFAPAGELVGTADMAPCLGGAAGDCPLYSPGAEYDVAVEVFEGDLGDLLIGPGARLDLLEGSEADRCPER